MAKLIKQMNLSNFHRFFLPFLYFSDGFVISEYLLFWFHSLISYLSFKFLIQTNSTRSAWFVFVHTREEISNVICNKFNLELKLNVITDFSIKNYKLVLFNTKQHPFFKRVSQISFWDPLLPCFFVWYFQNGGCFHIGLLVCFLLFKSIFLINNFWIISLEEFG